MTFNKSEVKIWNGYSTVYEFVRMHDCMSMPFSTVESRGPVLVHYQAASPVIWHLTLRVLKQCPQTRNCVQPTLRSRVPGPLCVLVAAGSKSITVLRE